MLTEVNYVTSHTSKNRKLAQLIFGCIKTMPTIFEPQNRDVATTKREKMVKILKNNNSQIQIITVGWHLLDNTLLQKHYILFRNMFVI